MKFLVFVEQRDGKLKNNAYEALSLAAKLSGNNAANVAAVICGKGSQALVNSLEGYGADKVFVADHDDLGHYNVLNYTHAVAKACEAFSANVVVGCASPMGRDLLPRLAARLDAGIVTDAVEVKLEGEGLVATKPMYAGKCLAEVALAAGSTQIVSIRQNVFGAEKSGQGAATAETLDFSPAAADRLKTTEVKKGASEKADLTEAVRIISGGRAMANAENFKILDNCADVLGATVGASRAAVDSGYAPHSMQVGQTGKTVNPNLYIACGISGSIQHMAGMRTSKVIVAINTDPEAPIFTVADYGIVADLFEAVPLLTEKLKSML